MKRKTFTALCIIAVAIISGYGGMKVYQLQSRDSDNLFLQNVEALAVSSEKKSVSGELITCDGPAIYAFPRIISGKFSYYQHTNKSKIQEDKTVIYYDDEYEATYEICVASGTGDFPGANGLYVCTDKKLGETECSQLCSTDKNTIFSNILYSVYH